MSVVVGVTFKAKDETFEELKQTMKAILPDTAAFEGAELIRAAADEGDRSVFIYEVWDRIESQRAYLAWRSERGDVEKLVALLREPPVFTEMTELF